MSPDGSPRHGSHQRRRAIEWPEGKAFAFTVFDDTDWTTLANGRPVYDLLTGLGFRITKSVWPIEPTAARTTGGMTCADPEYLEWVLSLRDAGHEIGYHNATDHPSYRDETRAALEKFRELFGDYPRTGADHAGNSESLYAGPKRLSGWRAAAYSLMQRVLQPQRPGFSGEDSNSRYFWGDLCRQYIKYWRNFTFAETDTLSACPEMPYHDPARPYVNRYFAGTDAPRKSSFLKQLAPDRLDELERSGGACIVYTHLGLDFVADGVPDPDFASVMEDLAGRNGWFVPVADLLDFIESQRPPVTLDKRGRRRLELRWIADRVKNSRRFGPKVATTVGRSG